MTTVFIPRHPLQARQRLALGLAPGTRIVRAP